MSIKGMEGLTYQEVNQEIMQGGRFVVYQYCISVIVMTFRRRSKVFFIRAGKNAAARGLPYALISLLLGWWGIPWGPVYTIQSLVRDLSGGKDVTEEVRNSLFLEANKAAGG